MFHRNQDGLELHLNYGKQFMPLVALTIPGFSCDVQIVVTDLHNLHCFDGSLLKEKYCLKIIVVKTCFLILHLVQ